MHIVLVVRTAASVAMPPRQAIANLYKSKVGGNCVRLPNRRQSDSEDRSKPSRLDTTPSRHLITRKGYATSVRQQSCQRLCNPQAAQLFKCQSANAKPAKGLFFAKENGLSCGFRAAGMLYFTSFALQLISGIVSGENIFDLAGPRTKFLPSLKQHERLGRRSRGRGFYRFLVRRFELPVSR